MNHIVNVRILLFFVLVNGFQVSSATPNDSVVLTRKSCEYYLREVRQKMIDQIWADLLSGKVLGFKDAKLESSMSTDSVSFFCGNDTLIPNPKVNKMKWEQDEIVSRIPAERTDLNGMVLYFSRTTDSFGMNMNHTLKSVALTVDIKVGGAVLGPIPKVFIHASYFNHILNTLEWRDFFTLTSLRLRLGDFNSREDDSWDIQTQRWLLNELTYPSEAGYSHRITLSDSNLYVLGNHLFETYSNVLNTLYYSGAGQIESHLYKDSKLTENWKEIHNEILLVKVISGSDTFYDEYGFLSGSVDTTIMFVNEFKYYPGSEVIVFKPQLNPVVFMDYSRLTDDENPIRNLFFSHNWISGYMPREERILIEYMTGISEKKHD